MAVMSTGDYGKLLWPGLNEIWGKSYKEHEQEWRKIFPVYTSSKAYEEDQQIVGFGMASVIGEGEAVSYDKGQQGFNKRYTHVKYGLGFVITEEMYEDNQYQSAVMNKPQALAFTINRTQETVGANILNRAFSNSYTGADSKELCATDHPNVSGGTYKNELTTAADLSEASLEQALIDIGGFTEDRGGPIKILAKQLVIPINLEFEATRILKSALQNDTAQNAINALKATGAIPGGIVMNHYLTDTDAWFITTDCPSGLKCFMRKPVTFAEDNDWDTNNAKFKATFRASWGWTDPRGIFGSPGA